MSVIHFNHKVLNSTAFPKSRFLFRPCIVWHPTPLLQFLTPPFLSSSCAATLQTDAILYPPLSLANAQKYAARCYYSTHHPHPLPPFSCLQLLNFRRDSINTHMGGGGARKIQRQRLKVVVNLHFPVIKYLKMHFLKTHF